ncbi:hypothetical protein BD311DRAFT_767494 [Dichomitus squalens]|uniref:Uncharacterized protein n=1 Tax=Dichomitus squalens TaxID=114155 RepID=A0A4Q9MA67_9APHY|nr:hypothetical protein BD311DRAFT_767494 [Dichomitus squalens]
MHACMRAQPAVEEREMQMYVGGDRSERVETFSLWASLRSPERAGVVRNVDASGRRLVCCTCKHGHQSDHQEEEEPRRTHLRPDRELCARDECRIDTLRVSGKQISIRNARHSSSNDHSPRNSQRAHRHATLEFHTVLQVFHDRPPRMLSEHTGLTRAFQVDPPFLQTPTAR